MTCRYRETCRKDICNNIDDCVRRIKLEALFGETLLAPNQQKKITFKVDCDWDMRQFQRLTEIQASLVDWVRDGNNLYLYSTTPGNGKTSWATRFIQVYLHRIWPESPLTCRALFVHVPTFLLELKANISKESSYITHIMENIDNADLVIWDDIATKNMTEFEGEHLLSYIERRLIKGKSNIFTSNIITDDLYKLVGDRLASRIINRSETIELRGRDKRGLK